MATVNDIDTKTAVGKFLQRQILTPQTDGESDVGEEVQALLETVATSFLLFPQAALPLIFRGKNSLRQVVQADIDTIDFIVKAIGDIRNPDVEISDVSDLIEAQTALVELDRLGRVSEDLQAFSRYQGAVDRFLNNQLGPSLKRKSRKEFERSGSEAKQDIFDILSSFGSTHRVVADLLEHLQGSVNDFNSVDLTRLVSTRTITRVRSSLRYLQNRVESSLISNTVAAIELLSGSAALQAVATNIDIYDPTVDTGSAPTRRTVYLSPESGVKATAISSVGPWTVGSAGPWTFEVELNEFSATPLPYSLELPAAGASDRVFVYSDPDSAAATYNIPAGATLYLFLEGPGVVNPYQEIALTTTGPAVPFATIVSEIDAALTDATCIEFNPGTNQFLIYADLDTTERIVVRPDSAADTGTYTDPTTNPSVGETLGFGVNQESDAKGVFSAESLKDSLSSRMVGATLEVSDDQLTIVSDLDNELENAITFDSAPASSVQSLFGFADGVVEAEPSYMELIEDGVAIDPSDVSVFVGGVVTAAEEALVGSELRTLNNEIITDIDETKIYFSSNPLPRSTLMDVRVDAPIVVAAQQLIQALSPFVGDFEEDFTDLQQVLSPIVSSPTVAQVNDALSVLTGIRDKLTNDSDTGLLDVLDSLEVRSDRSEFNYVADQVLKSLEERGLDRAIELIESGRFSEFFALDKNVASKSTRFMTSMEQVMVNDVPISFIERDIDDDQRPSGSNPDEGLLSDKNTSGEDEDLLEYDEDDDL